ncbi:MAG: DNA polymerase Y family protein [Sphingobium sp.]|nr:DNA polymerase Y family protein [Sphingobium sp.]
MTQANSGRRRFLALVFPFLAADLFRLQTRTLMGASAGASPADDTQSPHVFTVKQRGAFRLHALDERALALGLEPGMPLADARARIPGLVDLPHDPEGETALMARLADMAQRFTPMVEIDPPEGLVLDIEGCAHLFGGEEQLAEDAAHFMIRQGMRVFHARADSPEAALALARLGKGRERDEVRAIRHLPLLALRLPSDTLLALRRAGFACIGDLADLPPSPLAARFGRALVDALDRLLGRQDSRIVPRRALPPIFAVRRFPEPVARIETVMLVLGDLLEAVCETLRERHEGGRRFALRLFRSDGAMRDLAVETGAPVREAAVVLRLVNERIEALSDPLDPGFGFDMVRLAVPWSEALVAEQAGLMSGPDDAHELAALLDRLGTRLGAQRFRRLAPQGSHVPERETRLMASEEAAVAWAASLPGEPPLRPLTLFDPPERIEVLAQVPDGPPRQFRWRGSAHRIVAQEGPERIAPEWWRRPGGHEANPGLSRDYYRVEDEGGRRFWLFRHGLYERETNAPHWYVHGLFA